MDLKQVQEELRKDILHHQALMEQLKKRPMDRALNLKLKDVQNHIADLGSKQKKFFESQNSRQIGASKGNPSGSANVLSPTLSPSRFLTQQFQGNIVKQGGNDFNSAKSSKASGNSSSYALITIKSQASSSTNFPHLVTTSSNNIPMNLTSQIASKSGNGFASPTTLLVVSSPNQTSSKQQGSKSVSIPVSLASLSSNGGVVTLAGSWKSGHKPSASTSNTADMGRRVPANPVQIKLPVVQNSGSKSVILMSQKNPPPNSKSLFRLLPKAQHGLSVNGPMPIASGVSAQTVIPSTAIKNTSIPQKQVSAILMPGDAGQNSKTLQRLFVQRTDQVSAVPHLSSATWRDLSSQTPTTRKPSYIPMKSFPNINNGVGSFQKFRILDGKSETEKPIAHSLQCISSTAAQDKPRNSALKAVLTSNSVPTSGVMTVARILPLPASRSGFVPIQQQDATAVPKTPIKPLVTIPNVLSNTRAGLVTSISSANLVKHGKVKLPAENSMPSDTDEQEKLGFLRNIDLVPKEQAEKLRGRRFRKRRVAANPIYSGGVYVTNEIEPKRHCPDLLASAAESITAPDVIVKRPRGRPRGSKNSNTLAAKLQSSTRSNRSNSPANQANVQYVQQLKVILNSVTSSQPTDSSKPHIKAELLDPSHSKLENEPISEVSQCKTTSVKLKSGSTSSERSESPEGQSDEHEDQCAICSRTGEVLMCDTCSRVYHLSCATPPLSTVPQGMWVCSECKKGFKETKPKIEWPGISAAVHAFSVFDETRDKEIDVYHKKLIEVRRIVTAQDVQRKALTAVITTKVNHRMNATKERQNAQKAVNDLSAILKSCFNYACSFAESTPPATQSG